MLTDPDATDGAVTGAAKVCGVEMCKGLDLWVMADCPECVLSNLISMSSIANVNIHMHNPGTR